MTETLNDADLVTRVRTGDTEAFTVLVNRYEKAIYGLAYHHLGDFEDARDAAQESFIRAYLGLHLLSDPRKFGPWLRQVAMNQCRMRHRRHRETEPLDAGLPVADMVAQTDTRVAVQQALSCLSDPVRLTVTLFYMQSLSLQEIADFLEVPVTTVKSRLRDARARLKKEMAGMVEDTLKRESLPDGFAGRVQELIAASGEGKVATVRELLQHEPALINAEGPGIFWHGDSPALHLAVDQGHRDVVEVLLQQGADISIKSEQGLTPLYIAAGLESPEIMELLLSHGARPDIFTVLKLEDTAAVKAMLEADPSLVSIRGPWGATPLHCVRSVEIAQLLLYHGADINGLDEFYGSSPVDYQCYNPEVRDLLIARGAKIDIFLACYLGDTKNIGALIAVDPTLIDKPSYRDYHRPGFGATPLGVAAQISQMKAARFLLEHGAAVDAVSVAGLTPLHWAAMYGQRKVAALLLEYGADATLKTDGAVARWDGKTPLECAVEAFEKGLSFDPDGRDYEGVIALLRQ